VEHKGLGSGFFQICCIEGFANLPCIAAISSSAIHVSWICTQDSGTGVGPDSHGLSAWTLAPTHKQFCCSPLTHDNLMQKEATPAPAPEEEPTTPAPAPEEKPTAPAPAPAVLAPTPSLYSAPAPIRAPTTAPAPSPQDATPTPSPAEVPAPTPSEETDVPDTASGKHITPLRPFATANTSACQAD